MERSSQVIKQAWHQCNWGLDNLETLQRRLYHCRVEITKWSAKHRRDVHKEIEEKEARLREIQLKEGPGDSELINHLDKELDKLLELKDQKWRQGAKRNWYSLEDKNTRYFHACAMQKQKKNRIHSVLNEDNIVVDTDIEIEEVLNEYFQNLFTSSNPSSMELDDCL